MAGLGRKGYYNDGTVNVDIFALLNFSRIKPHVTFSRGYIFAHLVVNSI